MEKPDIFDTDQGSQYTSYEHTKILLESVWMGKGRALDAEVYFIENNKLKIA